MRLPNITWSDILVLLFVYAIAVLSGQVAKRRVVAWLAANGFLLVSVGRPWFQPIFPLSPFWLRPGHSDRLYWVTAQKDGQTHRGIARASFFLRTVEVAWEESSKRKANPSPLWDGDLDSPAKT